MSAAAPWSVKGIDPKAREVAKDLARRSGMTLGEWLNTMIMEDGDEDDTVAPLPRRAHASELFDRRGRSRRLDDAYEGERFGSSDETLQRVAASVDAIAARLEAAERRSTVAIQGVDQAVNGLVRRLDGADQQTRTYGRRIDDISEELKEGHRRLRTFENEVGPQTRESFGKVETGLGAIAARLYDMEERQRSSVNELRQRMDTVEKAAPGVGAEAMALVGSRLDLAQARTSEALKGLERSFADLDQRLRAAEGRVEPEGVRESARFEKLAETLARQVEVNRADMMRRLDTAESEGRMDRIERAVAGLGDTLKVSEQRSAQGIEAMGREVMRIAQNLNGRVNGIETEARVQAERADVNLARKVDTAAQTLNEKLDRDMGRYAQAVEQRLNRTDDQHALALEKLGGEITRISDRLADRIAQSERKSSQALEDIGRRLSDSSERIEQTYDRASGELAERMRLSEERTAQLLRDARERLEQRGPQTDHEGPNERAAPAAPLTAQELAADLQQPDWRAAAFPGEDFGAPGQDVWSTDTLGGDQTLAPFPTAFGGTQPLAAAVLAETNPSPRVSVSEFEPMDVLEAPFAPQAFAGPAPVTPFGGFGGADVSDAIEAMADQNVGPQAAGVHAFGVQAFAQTPSEAMPSGSTFDGDDFAGETEFVDPRAMRAGLSSGVAAARSTSTRSAIDAARAAMTMPSEPEPAPRGGFGLKRGGKSRLQERLDKQTSRDGSTIRKALLASVTGMAVIGAVYATGRLTGGQGFVVPGLSDLSQTMSQALGLSASTPGVPSPTDQTVPLASVALTPTDAVSAVPTEAQTLFDQAIEQLDNDQPSGVSTLTHAANLGLPAAQLKLVSLYETGSNGVTKSLGEARTWARRAAESQDPRGMHAYGMYLFDGVGGARNRPEALSWLLKAADRGLVDSQYNVARIYETGDEGIAPNPTEAFKWYLIAARSGDQQAQGSVERLTPALPAAGRRTARAAADAFQVEPLA